MRILRWIFRVLVIVLLAATLSGCWIRSLFGNVIYTTDISEEVNEIITTVFSDSTAAICLGTDFGFYNCTYIVGGEILTSSIYLFSELGLAGVLVDPLVLQVPADVSLLEATYDSGSGPQPLVSQEVTSFEAEPQTLVEAETGMKFVILEFPPAVEAALPGGDPALAPGFDLSVRLSRTRPISETVTAQSVKAMFTGKVVVNGYTYYPPMLPCTTDFASIPTIEVPLSNTQQDLSPGILSELTANPQLLCDHQSYDYSSAPPPQQIMLYLPIMKH